MEDDSKKKEENMCGRGGDGGDGGDGEEVEMAREGECLGRSVFASGETEPLSRAKIKQ